MVASLAATSNLNMQAIRRSIQHLVVANLKKHVAQHDDENCRLKKSLSRKVRIESKF